MRRCRRPSWARWGRALAQKRGVAEEHHGTRPRLCRPAGPSAGPRRWGLPSGTPPPTVRARGRLATRTRTARHYWWWRLRLWSGGAPLHAPCFASLPAPRPTAVTPALLSPTLSPVRPAVPNSVVPLPPVFPCCFLPPVCAPHPPSPPSALLFRLPSCDVDGVPGWVPPRRRCCCRHCCRPRRRRRHHLPPRTVPGVCAAGGRRAAARHRPGQATYRRHPRRPPRQCRRRQWRWRWWWGCGRQAPARASARRAPTGAKMRRPRR